MVDRFAEDWRSAGLDPETTALLDYAERLTDAPSSVGTSEIEDLRMHGLGDEAISSATQVIAYFNYINRVAEGLGVAHEDWLDSDGRPKSV